MHFVLEDWLLNVLGIGAGCKARSKERAICIESFNQVSKNRQWLISYPQHQMVHQRETC